MAASSSDSPAAPAPVASPRHGLLGRSRSFGLYPCSCPPPSSPLDRPARRGAPWQALVVHSILVGGGTMHGPRESLVPLATTVPCQASPPIPPKLQMQLPPEILGLHYFGSCDIGDGFSSGAWNWSVLLSCAARELRHRQATTQSPSPPVSPLQDHLTGDRHCDHCWTPIGIRSRCPQKFHSPAPPLQSELVRCRRPIHLRHSYRAN
ncbi:unnamed protein product [Urochloa humidicola]